MVFYSYIHGIVSLICAKKHFSCYLLIWVDENEVWCHPQTRIMKFKEVIVCEIYFI